MYRLLSARRADESQASRDPDKPSYTALMPEVFPIVMILKNLITRATTLSGELT